jgi:hypothetical protein
MPRKPSGKPVCGFCGQPVEPLDAVNVGCGGYDRWWHRNACPPTEQYDVPDDTIWNVPRENETLSGQLGYSAHCSFCGTTFTLPWPFLKDVRLVCACGIGAWEPE